MNKSMKQILRSCVFSHCKAELPPVIVQDAGHPEMGNQLQMSRDCKFMP
jgi:hypothetical protein